MSDVGETAYRIGVDTGGTFTDLVMVDGRGVIVATHKLLSTPSDPAQAVLDGIKYLLSEIGGECHAEVVHGSTVATNALLERKTARAALLTTAGFEDTLTIARQNRPELYALIPRRAEPLIAREMTLGVDERIGFDGAVIDGLAGLDGTIDELAALRPESIAVCLLHSYANPDHEREIGEALRRRFPGVPLTLSHELLPEMREYERCATSAINAAVAPRMTVYLGRLASEVGDERLSIMASHAGTLSVQEVSEQPVRTILSGPAGGALGAMAVARSLGHDRVITFDMGGTSTDVALLHGRPTLTTEGVAADLPVRLPMVDLHTVGAGGGSIAWMDEGGALRVGPQSCGADPGPACYGRQTGGLEPAVTDAHAYLGNLPADIRLAGSMPLDLAAATSAIEGLAQSLKLKPRETAEGILAVAEATMARAIRKVSLERGHDPAEHAMVTFGGAGGLHACRLAEELGIRTILVPAHAGLLSAVGMLTAPRSITFSRSVMRLIDSDETRVAEPGESWLNRIFPEACRAVEHSAASWFERHGIPLSQRRMRHLIDLRYRGQSFEIAIELGGTDPLEVFEREHRRLYGYNPDATPVEAVTLRLEASGQSPSVAFAEQQKPAAIDGPTLLRDASSTLLIREGWRARLTMEGHAILEPMEAGS